MNKGRVEAFTDAIIAIILTIMILEFKVPESTKLSAIIPDIPFIVSYAIGYFFIGTAWYNHHYMFSKTKLVTQRVFWTNIAWMFATSFLPVATAWVGEHINSRGPQIFYAIIYTLWSITYALLTYYIAADNEKAGHPEIAKSIRSMRIYRFMTNWKTLLIHLVLLVLTLIFIPALQLALVLIQIIFVGSRFNKDSDKLF
ncbi:TMEM175 family protein [Companilactobacillus ginsenosidimutans]|uniref:Membrane protein n=1 Tax=Companilactobacillus ginsenosidimutans TaxID=1007676 RepID=A0A0H4QGW7_9LACO|nr:TMEM175 family protein [Companilactobacillus ginsenosidimutans]AKP66256.1 membrane protein [Companilactobacillus ginsenosidimutans]